jgi:DNA-binding transcriptional ArsR family regulator
MEMSEAIDSFGSLSQETRLRVFKFILEYGRDGVSPGVIASELGLPDNTLSFHLSHMSRAGLVTSSKSGRTITYFANVKHIENLIEFLQLNCCAKEKSRKTKSKTCNEGKC